MNFKGHCKLSKKQFNHTGATYHKWIDSYALKYGYSHRDILHHQEGIEIGVQIYGEISRQHLEQHIIIDYQLGDKSEIPSIKELREESQDEIQRTI